MDFRIDGNPDYGHLRVELRPGDRIVAEGGSMAWMSAGTKVKVRLLGGLFKALIRRLVANESLFVAEYSHPGIGMVTFSPATPGSVAHRRLDGDSFILTAGSYMASTPGVTLKTRFGGLRSLFSGEGAFLLECSGTGDLFYNAYGALVEKEDRRLADGRHGLRRGLGAGRQLLDPGHGEPEEHPAVRRGAGDELLGLRQGVPPDADHGRHRRMADAVLQRLAERASERTHSRPRRIQLGVGPDPAG